MTSERKPNINRIVAAVVFLVALINFAKTVAPTTSFWDCGEFIAASYTMGVPHPPGAPLYLMIGRLFSMLPLAENVGLRVNLVSTVVSAFTVLFLYLCLVRLIRAWRGREETIADMITIYGGSVVGAFAFAFSHSFWFNAVEAEVYSVSMFFTAVTFYLALWWLDYADKPYGNKILLLIFYMVGLSCGIHLLNVLALISVTYIIAFRKVEANTKNFLLTGLIGTAVILVIYPGIIQGLPLLIEKLSIWSVVLVLILLVWLSWEFIRRERRIPALATLSILLVIVGYSTYLIIKIRSGLDPFLDENNPETWSGLLAYLNREQYGTESLFLAMFKRKAPLWSYQINHMYIRYFSWQFFDMNKLYMLPFILGIIGAVHHFYRDAKGAFTVLALFIMTGLAILLYLNQDDPQPRERDYAYVGSFFAFSIWIGTGAVALADTVRENFRKLKPSIASSAVILLCVIAVPLNMWVKNYDTHDRSGNFVAWDYAYNLLMSCDQDAILYTNGDNDTFPLWYMQVVEGVRPDVRVANLSLLNTGWFIKQIRDKYPVAPMTSRITDRYIENVIEARDATSLLDRRWQPVRRVSVAGPTPEDPKLVWSVPATLSIPVGSGRTEHFLRVQDQMILNTIVANQWERPIVFAVTCPDNNLIGLRNVKDLSQNYLSMEGLSFSLIPYSTPEINPEKMAYNMLKLYKYRNVNNSDMHFGESQLKLLGNYRQAFLRLAYYYVTETTELKAPDSTSLNRLTELLDGRSIEEISLDDRVEIFDELPIKYKALTVLDFLEDRIPERLVPVKYDFITTQIGQLYARLGHFDELAWRLEMLAEKGRVNSQSAFEYGAYFLTEPNEPEMARKFFEISLAQDPSFENHKKIALTCVQLSDDQNYPTEVLRRFLRMDPSRQGQMRVGEQALRLMLGDLSLEIFNLMFKENPDDIIAAALLIESHKLLRNYEVALGIANEWLGTHPGDSSMIKQRQELLRIVK